MRDKFYGPSEESPLTEKSPEYYQQGYVFSVDSKDPGIILVGQGNERAGRTTLADLAHAALMHGKFSHRAITEDESEFLEITGIDGEPFKVAMYAIQAYMVDVTKEEAISRIQKMTDEHVMNDARMRLLMGEFTWEKIPS